MPAREKKLKTIRDVLDDLMPRTDEDAVFRKEAAVSHIIELLYQSANKVQRRGPWNIGGFMGEVWEEWRANEGLDT